MKNVLMVLAAFAMAFLYTGCKGSEGPQGPAGPVGDSTHALEGFAAGIRCGDCHNPETDTTYHVMARKYQWEQSKHANGGDIERNGASCAGCHTSEGYVQRINTGVATDQPNPSPPGCFACHSPHSRGNFSLRTTAPVTLLSNITGKPDMVFDYGKGNLCASCHKPRPLNPKVPTSGDSVVFTSARWSPHYGMASLMLSGQGGFEFPGYTYSGNSYHSTATIIKEQGCPTCHMAQQVYPPNQGTGKAGGHTMNIKYEGEGGVEAPLLTGCKQAGCHASITTTDFAGPTTAPRGLQTVVLATLDTLQGLLAGKGWVDTVHTSPNYGLLKLTGGKLVVKPAIKAGAIYNWYVVKYDFSNGVHNTKYTLDLLRSSIEALRTP